MVHPLSSSLIQRMLSPRIGNNMAGISREDENSFWRFPGEIRNETYGYWISCGDRSIDDENEWEDILGNVAVGVGTNILSIGPSRLPRGKIGEEIERLEIQ